MYLLKIVLTARFWRQKVCCAGDDCSREEGSEREDQVQLAHFSRRNEVIFSCRLMNRQMEEDAQILQAEYGDDYDDQVLTEYAHKCVFLLRYRGVSCSSTRRVWIICPL